ADLQPHQQGQRPADQEEDQAGEQKLDADDLVIFGENVFAEEAQLRMGVRLAAVGMADAHAQSSLVGNRLGPCVSRQAAGYLLAATVAAAFFSGSRLRCSSSW